MRGVEGPGLSPSSRSRSGSLDTTGASLLGFVVLVLVFVLVLS